MKGFMLLTEPAEYTVAFAREVLAPCGWDYAFRFGRSLAAEESEVGALVLAQLPWWRRLHFLWQMLRAHQAIIVHSYVASSSLFLIACNLLFRKPLGIDADDGEHVPREWLRRVVKRVWLGWLFTRPWCFGISPGFQAHRRLFLAYGMPREHTFTVPMCVENARFTQALRPSRAAERPFRFGYLGRLVPHKRVEAIVEAFKLLAPGAATLEIVGEGPLRAQLESAAGAGVKVLGPRFGAAKAAWLKGLDGLVLFSDYEPWGLVVNEALAAGVPCLVGAKVGCAADLVAGSGGGEVVPAGDVEALAEAMARWCRVGRQIESMGRDGAAFMRERWHFGVARACFEAMLREVAQW